MKGAGALEIFFLSGLGGGRALAKFQPPRVIWGRGADGRINFPHT